MKILHWDAINDYTGQPYTWDDPNLRWGSPSYALEEGGPGFVPYGPSSPSNPPKPKKKMKRQTYYPSRQAEQIVWLQTFRIKLAEHATALGLDPAVVAEIIKDCQWVEYILRLWLPAVRTLSKAATTAANEAQTGRQDLPAELPTFTAPDLDGAVPRDQGALLRIFDLVQEIKENNACTDTMCQELGILGAEETGPDFATLRPVFTVTVTPAGNLIDWTWQGYSKFLDMLELQVDRGDGNGFVPLTFDTTPGYTDTHPQPATLTQWKYRGIFHVEDTTVGQWSEVVTVAVGG